MKKEILYGIHPVREAILAERRTVFKLYIPERKAGRRIREVMDLAEARNIPIERLASNTLQQKLKTDHHQGIGAEASTYPISPFAEVVKSLDAHEKAPMVMLLDQIVDPQNLGALIRTALSVHIDGVFIPKDRSASPTPAVSRVSAGALEHIRVSRVTNLASTINILKKKGFWVVGLHGDAAMSIFSADLKGPLALIIGSEQKGIRPLVRKQCDLLVSIPQNSKIDSLNASVAGAVALYEAYRQRNII